MGGEGDVTVIGEGYASLVARGSKNKMLKPLSSVLIVQEEAL
jgi:hypothetical protein